MCCAWWKHATAATKSWPFLQVDVWWFVSFCGSPFCVVKIWKRCTRHAQTLLILVVAMYYIVLLGWQWPRLETPAKGLADVNIKKPWHFWLSDSFVIVRQKRRQQDPEMIWDLWKLMVFSFLFAVQPFLQTRLNHRCCWTETMYASWCKPWRGTSHLSMLWGDGAWPVFHWCKAAHVAWLAWGVGFAAKAPIRDIFKSWEVFGRSSAGLIDERNLVDLHQTIGSHSIHPRFVHEKSRLSPIVTGATVVGLKYKDGVILAADTLAPGDSMHFAAWDWGGFRCKMGRCPQPQQRYSRSAKIWWKISGMTFFQRFSHFMTWFAGSQ